MSGPDREPEAPSFERVRELAKQLTRACRTGDAAALERLRKQLPRLAALAPAEASARVRLADAQHALAREAGVANWAALKLAVQSQEPLVAQLARFHRALREGDLDTMRRVLERFPEVAQTSLHAACAACDEALVERWLAKDGSLVKAGLPPLQWTPLDCLAASPAFRIDDRRRASSARIGLRLLDLGADANSFTLMDPADPGSKLSVLFRASEQGNAGLVKVLLEHGAQPNDGESAYHAAEHDGRDVLELLLAHGAEISAAHPPWNNTILYFLAGYRSDHPNAHSARAGMEWLLEHGADPNVPSYESRETPLHRLTEYGHPVETLQLFLRHGADPKRARADGRTPFELAMRVGHGAAAELFRSLGGAVELRPIDTFLHACTADDEATARRLYEERAELRDEVRAMAHHALVFAAESGNASAVRILAQLGLTLDQEGPWGGTPLHHAAWRGLVPVVKELLAAGAPVNVRDRTYGSTPLAWAAHGSGNCRQADDDYIAIIDLLLEAGSERAPSYNNWKEPPENLSSDAVADHLRFRGFAPVE